MPKGNWKTLRHTKRHMEKSETGRLNRKLRHALHDKWQAFLHTKTPLMHVMGLSGAGRTSPVPMEIPTPTTEGPSPWHQTHQECLRSWWIIQDRHSGGPCTALDGSWQPPGWCKQFLTAKCLWQCERNSLQPREHHRGCSRTLRNLKMVQEPLGLVPISSDRMCNVLPGAQCWDAFYWLPKVVGAPLMDDDVVCHIRDWVLRPEEAGCVPHGVVLTLGSVWVQPHRKEAGSPHLAHSDTLQSCLRSTSGEASLLRAVCAIWERHNEI